MEEGYPRSAGLIPAHNNSGNSKTISLYQGQVLVYSGPYLMGTPGGIFLAIALFLETLLVILLLHRKIHKEFPFFFIHTIYSVITSTVELAVNSHYRVYFVVYWSADAGFAVLAILALHEVFRRVFALFYDDWWFAWVFPAAVTLICLTTVWYWFEHPPIQAPRTIGLILSLGVAVNIVRAMLFGLFFLLVAHSRLRWRSYPFGIVGGFAILSLGAWGTYWARSEFGTKFNIFARAVPITYIVALAFWMLTFMRAPEPEPEWALKMTPQEALQEVQKYSEFINRFLGRKRKT